MGCHRGTAATTSETGEPAAETASRCVDATAEPWTGDPAMTILDVLATGHTDGTVDLGTIEPVSGVVVDPPRQRLSVVAACG